MAVARVCVRRCVCVSLYSRGQQILISRFVAIAAWLVAGVSTPGWGEIDYIIGGVVYCPPLLAKDYLVLL